jgi:hypothetical protein
LLELTGCEGAGYLIFARSSTETVQRLLKSKAKSLLAHSRQHSGGFMSIADLKTRLHDVPGIETLSMQMLAGQQNYNLDGRVIQVDAAASDVEMEQAIRSAIATPGRRCPAGQPSSRPAFGAEHSADRAKRISRARWSQLRAPGCESTRANG